MEIRVFCVDRAHMMMLLSPTLSFNRCLASSSRTRIPVFFPVCEFRRDNEKTCVYTDPPQSRLAPLGHHQRKISRSRPIRTDISWVVGLEGYQGLNYVSLAGEEDWPEPVNGCPFWPQYVDGMRPILCNQFYHGTSTIHDPSMRPIIDN